MQLLANPRLKLRLFEVLRDCPPAKVKLDGLKLLSNLYFMYAVPSKEWRGVVNFIFQIIDIESKLNNSANPEVISLTETLKDHFIFKTEEFWVEALSLMSSKLFAREKNLNKYEAMVNVIQRNSAMLVIGFEREVSPIQEIIKRTSAKFIVGAHTNEGVLQIANETIKKGVEELESGVKLFLLK